MSGRVGGGLEDSLTDEEWTGEDSGQENGERSSIAPRYLAGWLFADLFLVLFVIVLGLLPPSDPLEKHPPVPPTRSPSASASDTGRQKEKAGGIDPTYKPVAVRFSNGATAGASHRKGLTAADAAKVANAVADEVAKSGRSRRIGMLLTFGGAPQFEENARTLARQTNDALLAKKPGLFCGKNVGRRAFWDGDPFNDGRQPYDSVRVEVYYTNSCEEP